MAHDALKRVLAPINYANLDELDIFGGKRSTTEVIAKYVFDAMATEIRNGNLGEDASGIERLKITLNESHVARGWYEAQLADA